MTTEKRSGFEGGLWIIPLALVLASIYSIVVRAIPQWKSGTCKSVTDEFGVVRQICDETVRVNFFTIGSTIFGLALLVAAIIAVIIMRRDR